MIETHDYGPEFNQRVQALKKRFEHVSWCHLMPQWNYSYPKRGLRCITMVYNSSPDGAHVTCKFDLKDSSAETFMEVEQKIYQAMELADKIASLK